MFDKTTKTAITPQTPVALEPQATPRKAAAHRVPPKSIAALDKKVPGLELALTLADDHQAPMARAPSLEGVQTPEPPRKVKSESLAAKQRAALGSAFEGLQSARQAARSGYVSRIAPGKTSPIKEPSVLEFVGSSGEKQRWFVSPSQRRGTYGKFRIAVLDTPAGEPPVIMAIKEYRLPDRRPRSNALKPSYDQRRDAIAALEQIVDSHPSLSVHTRSLTLDLQDPFKPLSRKAYDKMVDYIEQKAEAMGRPLSEDVSDSLQLLAPQTQTVDEGDIAAENVLYPLTNSPLRVQESVEHDGRVYNFSELMRGELFDVVACEQLGEADRKIVARSTARDATARLGELHDADIVHRDIKLENIFIDEEGKPQLGDWGFATLLQDGKATGLKGTMDYIAPEVLSGDAYGKPADIYSLGHTIAAAGMNDLLLDTKETFFFKHNGKRCSTQHEALSLIIEQLTFDKRGAIEASSLNTLKWPLKVPLPFEDPKIRMVVTHAIQEIMPRIKRWHKADPMLCATVLRHMLCGDPAARSDTHALEPLFAKLQPADSAKVQHAQHLAKAIVADATDMDEEIAIVQAYGKAYNSEK